MPVVSCPTTQELWTLCQTHQMKMVAEKFNMTTQQIVARFQQSGLLSGGNRDPSPEEIEREKRAIQQRWDETTRQARWVGTKGKIAAGR